MPEEKILNRDAGNHEKEVSYMLEAYRMVPKDISLAKAVLRCPAAVCGLSDVCQY